MEKIESIVRALKKLEFKNLVELHNDWCEKNHQDTLYFHPMDNEHISLYFGTSAHLFMAIKNSEHFNPHSEYFRLPCAEITTDLSVIDYYKLAEHLIRYGDATYSFDITESLKTDFTDMVVSEYENGIREGNFNREQIENELSTMENDYLMEDWNDLSRELWECLIVYKEE